MTGLTAELVLLAVLASIVGLGPLGWAVGIASGAVTSLLLARALARAGSVAMSPADAVTLARATLVGAVAALTADSFVRPVSSVALVGLTVVALVGDFVDGRVARRTGAVTALGARFDMEVDAWLILVLSVYVAPMVGGWVLAIGLARYAYVAAGWLLSWLRGPVPPRYWRKVVAAIQGVTLTVAAADVLPRALTGAALVVALALLAESFGRDVVWLAATHAPEGVREWSGASLPG